MFKVHATDHELGAFANFSMPFGATTVFGCAHYNDVTVLCLITQLLDQK